MCLKIVRIYFKIIKDKNSNIILDDEIKNFPRDYYSVSFWAIK